MMAYWTKPQESPAEAVARINAMKNWPDSAKRAIGQPDAVVVAERQAFAERLRTRFEPTGDPYATAKRLGFSVGDPDNDGDWGGAA